MARERSSDDYVRPVRRLLVALLALACLVLFPPVAHRLSPGGEDAVRSGGRRGAPARLDDGAGHGVRGARGDFRSYQRIHEQNLELRRELQQMMVWREAAPSGSSRRTPSSGDLNNVQLDPAAHLHHRDRCMADSGRPFRQSVLLNVGGRDGIIDGWPSMDGIGLVGRVSGVGETTSG
jgi:rod shape-determining protein MreC